MKRDENEKCCRSLVDVLRASRKTESVITYAQYAEIAAFNGVTNMDK